MCMRNYKLNRDEQEILAGCNEIQVNKDVNMFQIMFCNPDLDECFSIEIDKEGCIIW